MYITGTLNDLKLSLIDKNEHDILCHPGTVKGDGFLAIFSVGLVIFEGFAFVVKDWTV